MGAASAAECSCASGKWSAAGSSTCADCAGGKSSTTSSNTDIASCTCSGVCNADVITEQALTLLSDPAAWRNEPFHHIVIEDFLKSHVLREVAAEAHVLPENAATSRFLDVRSAVQFNKLGFGNLQALGATTQEVFRRLHDAEFTSAVERGSGIHDIVADVGIKGGGIHQIKPLGFLNTHTDFNMYSSSATGMKLDRRLNILIYLNENWHDAWGGHLEFWDGITKQQVARYLPVANRCVIFATNKISWHGHPVPLNSPANRSRFSLASYYYTKNTHGGVDFEGEPPHNTRFVDWGHPKSPLP